jgi:RNAse (barnase) inhibitor barstar
MLQPASNGGGTWLTALEEEMQLAEMELAEFDKQWQKLSDEVQKPMRIEEPGWKKFFADNITPLQQYENEVAKLRGMLNEGPEGVRAFALGSANAIAKLKQATGLGGPQQFASAVQAGSAAEFQVKVDEMGKAKNVQEEIRQLMEAAAEMEQQQLIAAQEIATAIQNLPGLMPRPQAIAVAVNP